MIKRRLSQNSLFIAIYSPNIGWLSKCANQLVILLVTVNEVGFFLVATLMLFMEILIIYLIIQHVPYTEIDWTTYMQQVSVYLKGQKNYSLITGDTGPIVYPSAHLYIYYFLYLITNEGNNIRRAQYIFAFFYLVNLVLVYRLFYHSRRIPPFVLCLFSLTSYRLHSIFLLRLFNDPIAMLIFFAAVNCFISKQWLIGCILYSLAVGVKMNILLFAPALFFILLLTNGLNNTAWFLLVCALVQCFIAYEFLIYDPWAYLSRSFELSRVFFIKWTVNWRFLSESIFIDRRFHIFLLLCHLVFLVVLSTKLWFREQGGLGSLIQRLYCGIHTRIDVHDILLTLFTANLAGITFSRSLHYQFYCWYYHSIPYLLFSPLYSSDAILYKTNGLPSIKFVLLRLPIMLGLEFCWNTYPSTIFSSLLLHGLHAIIIYLLFRGQQNFAKNKKQTKQ